MGVVILSEPVTDLGFGELPPVGLAEELNSAPGSEAMLNIVGYGLQSVKPVEIAEQVRYQATPMLVEVNGSVSGRWNIHLSSNPGKGGGTGGTCFGDSGGPALACRGLERGRGCGLVCPEQQLPGRRVLLPGGYRVRAGVYLREFGPDHLRSD